MTTTTGTVPTSSSDKDEAFWNAVISGDAKLASKEKKRSKKYKKVASSSCNAGELAARFGIEKTDVEKVVELLGKLDQHQSCVQMHQLFLRLDDDGSGSITAPEIAQGLSMFGQEVSPKIVQVMTTILNCLKLLFNSRQ